MTRFRKALRTKRRKAAVIAALLALIPAGAFAYFVGHGSSHVLLVPGGSTTGAPTALWAINVDSYSGTPLSPGSGSETMSNVLISNEGAVTQYGASDGLTATVAAESNGDAESCTSIDCTVNGSPTDIPGCKASWFTVTITGQSATLQAIPTGLTLNGGNVTLTMPADSANDQSACENQSIGVNLNYSS
jgi:hypothetical protein